MGKSNPPPVKSKHPVLVGWARGLRAWTRPGGVAAFAFLLTIILLAPRPLVVPDQAGQQVVDDVRAPTRIEVQDVDAMTRERRKLQNTGDQIWTFKPEVSTSALRGVQVAADILKRQPESGADIKSIGDEIYQKSQMLLSGDEIDYLYKNVNMKKFMETLAKVASLVTRSMLIVDDETLYQSHMSDRALLLHGVPDEVLARGRRVEYWPEGLRSYLRESELRRFYPRTEDARVREIGMKMLMDVLNPTLTYDRKATDALRQGNIDRLEANPIRHVFEEGEMIAHGGDVLTLTQATALDKVNELRDKAYPYRLGGVVLLALTCLAGVTFYLGRLRNDLKFTAPNVTMICLPLLIVWGVGRLLMALDLDPLMIAALYPSALVGMLSTIMIGPSAGFILVLAAGISFGVATGQNLEFHVLSLFGGFAAVISLKSLRERKDILETGLHVGLVNLATVTLLDLFHVPFAFQPHILLSAFLNGLACAFVTLPLMAIFERAFGVVTDIRLLELTSPDNELIRMMEEKAPGSYQHVLNVTKLAESGAEEIGANFLLVRSGAYFHDIGKMLRPKYFSENQVTLDDKKAHSRISPYMSVLIIKNHVRDGIELAKEHHLPQKLIDFIPQHHGTSLIKYFYNEAMQRYQETESTDPVREEDFRYPGPKPQSIETAIVMLADSVEAIVTSVFTSSRVNENDLRRVVGQAISDRFQDGQFDECDLTMRDLSQLREAFVKTLKARFHQRIAYPIAPRKETGRGETREIAQPALAPAGSSHA